MVTVRNLYRHVGDTPDVTLQRFAYLQKALSSVDILAGVVAPEYSGRFGWIVGVTARDGGDAVADAERCRIGGAGRKSPISSSIEQRAPLAGCA